MSRRTRRVIYVPVLLALLVFAVYRVAFFTPQPEVNQIELQRFNDATQPTSR